jgi:hypothetical protein
MKQLSRQNRAVLAYFYHFSGFSTENITVPLDYSLLLRVPFFRFVPSLLTLPQPHFYFACIF